jgi:hypothetical protein
MKVARNRMKASCDLLANSAGSQEGDHVWLYRPTRTTGKSPKLQPSWQGPYKVITHINDVVFHIPRLPRAKMMAAHLDRRAAYLGATRVQQPYGGGNEANVSCDIIQKNECSDAERGVRGCLRSLYQAFLACDTVRHCVEQ